MKPFYSDQQVTEALTHHGSWGFSNLTFSFRQGSGDVPAFSQQQRVATREVLEQWADVSNLTFTEIEDGKGGNLHFGNDDDYDSDSTIASAYAPTTGNWFGGRRGNVTVNVEREGYNDPQIGSVDYMALTHEIGHALGLSHPGHYNGDGVDYEKDATHIQDSQQYTVMSYFGAYASGADHYETQWLDDYQAANGIDVEFTMLHAFNNDNYGFDGLDNSEANDGRLYLYKSHHAATPLLNDIMAIQSLYGANMATRSDDTTYGFNSTAGRDAFDFTINEMPVVAIWDGGGSDTIDLSGFSGDQKLDLNEAAFSSVGDYIGGSRGLTDNLAIARGAVIENGIGGSGDDTITGNSVANELRGNDGSDIIRGGEGSDYIYGGEDDDTLYGEDGDDRIYGDDGDDTITGGNGKDRIFGGDDDDTLYGQNDNDTIYGGTGEDLLVGGRGNDILYGQNDDDELVGNSGNDWLIAGDGNDFAHGGSGNDYINGGNGIDDLDGSYGNDRIYGGNNNDTIKGGSGNDYLHGGQNDDIISGGAGRDTLVGGYDDDTLTGGAGRDIFEIRNEASLFARTTITDFNNEGPQPIFDANKNIIGYTNPENDTIDLSAYGFNKQQISNLFEGNTLQINDDTFMILANEDVLVLEDTLVEDLNMSDFDF